MLDLASKFAFLAKANTSTLELVDRSRKQIRRRLSSSEENGRESKESGIETMDVRDEKSGVIIFIFSAYDGRVRFRRTEKEGKKARTTSDCSSPNDSSVTPSSTESPNRESLRHGRSSLLSAFPRQGTSARPSEEGKRAIDSSGDIYDERVAGERASFDVLNLNWNRRAIPSATITI